MIKILSLAILLAASTTQAADVLFYMSGDMVSLREVSTSRMPQGLDQFQWLFRRFDGRDLADNVMCVKIQNPDFVAREIQELDAALDDAFFATHTLAVFGGNVTHPLQLHLTDDAAQRNVGRLNVKFCR